MSQVTSNRNLRRGAILGLTIAEAFMLIAFILLFLFALWQKETRITDDSNLARAVRVLVGVVEEHDLKRVLEKIPPDELIAILELSESTSIQRVRDTERLIRNKSEAEIDRLMNLARRDQAGSGDPQLDSTLRELASAVAQTELGESIKKQSVNELIAKLNFIDERPPDEISRLMELARGDQGLRNEIREQLEDYTRDRKQLADALDQELGDIVRGMGGEIDETGRISLPSEVLFAAGKASLRPPMREFLERACEPWLRTLRAADVELSEIRIEGHASREWSGATSPSEAFLNNLDLSQRRAQTVLSECIDVTEDDNLKTWAQKYLTAIGYSSSRPVLNELDGTELLDESRRVVFGVQIDADKALRDIGSKVRD